MRSLSPINSLALALTNLAPPSLPDSLSVSLSSSCGAKITKRMRRERPLSTSTLVFERGREGEGGREGGREGGTEGGREEGRERERESARARSRERARARERRERERSERDIREREREREVLLTMKKNALTGDTAPGRDRESERERERETITCVLVVRNTKKEPTLNAVITINVVLFDCAP